MEKEQARVAYVETKVYLERSMARATRWLSEHTSDGSEEAWVIRDLYFLLASRPPTPPAAISLSRLDFARARESFWRDEARASEVWPNIHSRMAWDMAGADALLAAAGLAWKAEAGEGEGGKEAEARRPLADLATAMGRIADDKARTVGPTRTGAMAEAGPTGRPWQPSDSQPGPSQRWAPLAGRPDTVFDPNTQESVPLADWKSYDPSRPHSVRLPAALAEDRRRHEACGAEFAEARRQEADAALGAKMRELLASDKPPAGLDGAVRYTPMYGSRAGRAWAWLREQAGMDKAGSEPLPEQIGWAIDCWPLANGKEVMLPTLICGGKQDDKVYAEAVRRYNLHGKIEVWAEKYLDGSQTAAGRELSELMAEGAK